MNNEFDYMNGYLAGQMGKEPAPKASEDYLRGYGRAYEDSERESANAEQRDKELRS